VCNFTPVPRQGYRLGLPRAGNWTEIINSDLAIYGGSGHANGTLHTEPVHAHHRHQSVVMTLPPLATVILSKSAD
jgi:1,4-alpha-glucan branching enzyme